MKKLIILIALVVMMLSSIACEPGIRHAYRYSNRVPPPIINGSLRTVKQFGEDNVYELNTALGTVRTLSCDGDTAYITVKVALVK